MTDYKYPFRRVNMSRWRDIRLAVLERDERRCKLCGKESSAQVHHIVLRRRGGWGRDR